MNISINDVDISVEIADNRESRTQGLKHRERLPENHGMCFAYYIPRYLKFWMKDTEIPLSIAYINEAGEIINIEDMDIGGRSESLAPAKYALEMNIGWFERHGVKPGDIIKGIGAKVNESKRCGLLISESKLRNIIRTLLIEDYAARKTWRRHLDKDTRKENPM